MNGDTIAAIATAPGAAGVAVVRVSGPDAFTVAERLSGRRPAAGAMAVAPLRSPESGAVIDRCLVLAFGSPRSYTGEDVVEFQCHGGSVTPRRVLEAAFSAGARLARRGEFTERALLNGKLDYDQAESVLDLVNAKTSRAADVALDGLSGRGRRESRELYDAALGVSAVLEHALDVSEEELPEGFCASVSERLEGLRAAVGAAMRRIREGRLLRNGALVVLAGPPNVGKSSLMNALLGEDRAIVSSVPGTTRDSIEEWLDVGGWPVRLVDTAGLRDAADAIEAEGVRRSEALVEKADLVLRLSEAANAVAASADEERELRVFTKRDLLSCGEGERGGGVLVSAKTGEGLDELRRAIAAKLEALAESGAEGSGAEPDERALSAFIEAEAEVGDALERLAVPDLVLAANSVRHAAETLGSLVGAAYSDDLLENLFSRFCVGK